MARRLKQVLTDSHILRGEFECSIENEGTAENPHLVMEVLGKDGGSWYEVFYDSKDFTKKAKEANKPGARLYVAFGDGSPDTIRKFVKALSKVKYFTDIFDFDLAEKLDFINEQESGGEEYLSVGFTTKLIVPSYLAMEKLIASVEEVGNLYDLELTDSEGT